LTSHFVWKIFSYMVLKLSIVKPNNQAPVILTNRCPPRASK
jgi:hypothetical protein